MACMTLPTTPDAKMSAAPTQKTVQLSTTNPTAPTQKPTRQTATAVHAAGVDPWLLAIDELSFVDALSGPIVSCRGHDV